MADQSIFDTTGDIAKVLADYEAARAKGDVAQAGVNQNQANTANNLYRTAADVALTGPTTSARQAARGDVMANVQPFKFTGGTTMAGNIPVPTATGGLTPAAFGPNTREAGAKLGALGNSRVLSPSFNLPAQPSLAPTPTASGLDKTLGAAGVIGSVLGAAGKGLGGNGASFPIPFSGFKSFFGHGANEGPAGIENGSTDGLDAAYNFGQNTTQGIDPSQNVGGQVDDPVAAYIAWLQANGHDPNADAFGGADGTYGDNP